MGRTTLKPASPSFNFDTVSAIGRLTLRNIKRTRPSTSACILWNWISICGSRRRDSHMAITIQMGRSCNLAWFSSQTAQHMYGSYVIGNDVASHWFSESRDLSCF
ncbi:hypothetical protein AVEN_100704-1 [Araneus ventricosus]|uniref:Uncharacterized protein n=1 Tax=Araneus ventricosus TaxID=182803 RepID=A0A4Y2CUA3_ARAVE|nr:hypothetical protein AVEN_100704-1 [Araneus ventricosus]